MATNSVFRQFDDTMEQNFYEDLVEEAIQIYGHDMYYLPRSGAGEDDLMTEYSVSTFEKALPVELYMSSFSSFEGEGQLMSIYGMEIRDQITLVISHRSFNKFVKPTTENERPFEGDCIYVPMLNNIYQIKYVNTSPVFYTLGKLNTYELVCELIMFNNEVFNTGIPEIDDLAASMSPEDEFSEVEDYDPQARNKVIQTEANKVLDFSEVDPFEGLY